MRVNPNLNLDNTPLLHVDPFQIYAWVLLKVPLSCASHQFPPHIDD
jgi:hypothetical protein